MATPPRWGLRLLGSVDSRLRGNDGVEERGRKAPPSRRTRYECTASGKRAVPPVCRPPEGREDDGQREQRGGYVGFGRPHGNALRLRGDASLWAWYLGRARRCWVSKERAAKGGRDGDQPHRYGRRLRPRGKRASDLLRPLPLPRRPGDRHEGRHGPSRTGTVGAERKSGASARGVRGKPAPSQA